MILSENRYPSRIKSGTGFFGIMLWRLRNVIKLAQERERVPPDRLRDMVKEFKQLEARLVR